jgi:hypothetical protein
MSCRVHPCEANKYTVAADTTKLRKLWAREVNTKLELGMRFMPAIEHGIEAVDKAIRRAKRKGRR